MTVLLCSLALASCAPLRNVYKEDFVKIKNGELETEVNNLLGTPAKNILICENKNIEMNIYYYCERQRFADQITLLILPSLSLGSEDFANNCIKDRKSGFIIFQKKEVIFKYLNNDIGKIFLINDIINCMKNNNEDG